MRRGLIAICCIVGLGACDKHDPILPGVRSSIFNTSRLNIKNQTISDIPESAHLIDNTNCPYTQDSKNVIWDGQRRIFSGFPTNNTVKTDMRPVCDGRYIYAGLTTGELVKLNPQNRQIVWIADIYRPSNLTGGASMVDIIVPPVPYKGAVYAGGLGDAFCKVSATNGKKIWCTEISVAQPFVIAGNYAFVVATDDNLYAIKTSDGAIMWRTEISNQVAPNYESGIITVNREKINVADGKKVLDK